MALKNEVFRIAASDDVVRVRQIVRSWAAELKFSLVDQTKFVTATSNWHVTRWSMAAVAR